MRTIAVRKTPPQWRDSRNELSGDAGPVHRGARDNTEMEAWNPRFKNENRPLFLEAKDVHELWRVVTERMDYYNGERRHSALGNQAQLASVAGIEAGR